MSTEPAPSVARGDVTLQPSYFTSSLFVSPLREDIARLIQAYAQEYLDVVALGNTNATTADAQEQGGQGAFDIRAQESVTVTNPATSSTATPLREDTEPSTPDVAHKGERSGDNVQPFTLFKKIWCSQGWSWFHLKALDGRARESFLTVVLRLFSEYFAEQVNPLAQVIALFGMYTFYTTQPASGTPSNPVPGPSLYCMKHIALSHDTYHCLLDLPAQLIGPQLAPLSPYALYLLKTLLKQDAFHIYPHSSLKAQYELPREWFVEDPEILESDALDAYQKQSPKKKGRPGKGERAKKRKDALVQLDRWLERSTYTYPDHPAAGEATTSSTPGSTTPKRTTHTLISHPPNASLAIYQIQKQEYLNAMKPLNGGSPLEQLVGLQPDTSATPEQVREREAIRRANEAVLTRLKKIDEMAAEQGLEVGGEGGEMTGLERVEKAVKEMRGATGSGKRGGILNLVEGAGMDAAERTNEGGNGSSDTVMDVT